MVLESAQEKAPLSSPNHLEWVKRPRQARSQQTLERLLDAAEAVIAEQGLENTSVSEIAKRAKSSVGSFYTRFADKDALMRAVFERFNEQARATIDSVFAPDRWADTPLPDALRTVIRFLLRATRERHVLVASLAAYTGKDASVAASLDAMAMHLASRIYQLLAARGELPDRPDPAQAVAVLSGVMLASAQSRLLRPQGLAAPIDDVRLANELTYMALAYLGHCPTVRGG